MVFTGSAVKVREFIYLTIFRIDRRKIYLSEILELQNPKSKINIQNLRKYRFANDQTSNFESNYFPYINEVKKTKCYKNLQSSF